MNLNHLQYFLETCRYGSITKASEVCHISQPSITAAINNLEKELGAKLFDRVNNRLRLTVVGEGFKDLTEEFLKTFDDYCQSAYDIASSRYTKIRVGIPPFLSTIITKKLFPEFSVQHPNIRLEIVEVGLIDGLNKLNSSQLDCLIGVCRSKTFTCNSRCLFTTKLTLAVNRGSELVHRHKAISIAQMESIPLVTPVKGSYLYSLINEILASEKPNIVMQSNQLTTLKYMLRVDCAAAIIYDGLFNDNEDIVHIPFEEDIFLETHVFWQAGRYVSSSLKSFMSYISKWISVPIRDSQSYNENATHKYTFCRCTYAKARYVRGTVSQDQCTAKCGIFLQLFARSFVNGIKKNDANVKFSENESRN